MPTLPSAPKTMVVEKALEAPKAPYANRTQEIRATRKEAHDGGIPRRHKGIARMEHPY